MDQNMKPSLYLSLCTEFFDLDKPQASPEDLNFFPPLPRKSNRPHFRTNVWIWQISLFHTYKAGYNCWRLWCITFMLNALHANAHKKILRRSMGNQFLEGVPTTKVVNLIFIPIASFSLFSWYGPCYNVFTQIYSLLEDGGTFVFDVETV